MSLPSDSNRGSKESDPGEVLPSIQVGQTFDGGLRSPLSWDSEESDSAKDAQGLGGLLRSCSTEHPSGEGFWSFDTLCRVLTRDRVREVLAKSWPEEAGINTYIDQIAPVYETARDAQGKEPVRPSSEPKRFLKVFAILVLMDGPERIKDFIESDVCDSHLPLYMKPAGGQLHLLKHEGDEQSPACFRRWRLFELDTSTKSSGGSTCPSSTWARTATTWSITRYHQWQFSRGDA